MIYIYHNWKSNQKNKIHKGGCGYCNHGAGRKAADVTPGLNGVWIGPFNTYQQASDYRDKYIKDKIIDDCESCKPHQT